MPRLTLCPSCHSHVLVEDRECPHCGAALRTTGASRVAAAVMGLALTGCPHEPAPLYGDPGTGDDDSTSSSASTGSTDTSTGSTDTSTGPADTSTGPADDTSSGTGGTDATTGTGTDGTTGTGTLGEPGTTTG
jgi:hypothetical protein